MGRFAASSFRREVTRMQSTIETRSCKMPQEHRLARENLVYRESYRELGDIRGQ